MSRDTTIIRVGIGFKRLLRKKAAEADTDMVSFTRELEKLDDPFEPLIDKRKRKNAKKFTFF